MSDTIAVVKPNYALEEAYNMGYEEFFSLSGEETEDFDFAPFTDSARWANIILPKLRAMAGFDDRGHGTYRESRQVAAIEPGCEEDEPAEAELMDCSFVFEELSDAFRKGAYDAVEGNEREIPEW